MKRFSAVEWQTFSLKKDIETINKKLNNNQSIQTSLLIEVALVILGFAVPEIFGTHKYFWIIISVVSFIVVLIPLICFLYRKVRDNSPGSDRPNPKDFIDTFDNKITYYVLMSESYYTMLSEALVHNKCVEKTSEKEPVECVATAINDDVIRFYFIEASYYLRKAISDLTPITKIIDKTLSSDEKTILTEPLISSARYYNIVNLIKSIFMYLEQNESILNALDDGKLILSLNKTYKKELDNINDQIKEFNNS
jgi:hypothetical protein